MNDELHAPGAFVRQVDADSGKDMGHQHSNAARRMLRLYLTGGLAGAILPASADLAFDGTLGPTGMLAGDMVVEQAFGTLSADGGNLFHSFERLSVENGETLHFALDDPSIANIIGRVTGVDATFLDGPVSADANLFVVNPNGVILGAGASFDPSVVIEFASADTVFFDDGSVFRVRDRDAAATLSIASPDDFGFLSIATDDSLAPAEVLLDAEDGTAFIDSTHGALDGANLFLSFSAFSLYPQQAAFVLADPGIAHVVSRVTTLEDSLLNGTFGVLDADTFDVSPAEFWLANPHGLVFGSGAAIDSVAAFHGGAAGAVVLADGTVFGTTDPGAALSTSAPAGFDVTGATGTLRVRRAFLAPADRLTLTGRHVQVEQSTLAAPAVTLLAPDAGVAAVDDPEAVPLAEPAAVGGVVEVLASDLRSDVFRPGDGRDDPRLAIVGGRLVHLDDAVLTANTAGRALGRIRIRGGDVTVASSFLSANTQSDLPGEEPDVAIEAARTLSLAGTVVEADTTGAADAGNVLLVGSDVELSGTTIFAESFGGASGDAGDIGLVGDRISVADGSFVASRALAGTGDAGSVTLVATESVEVTANSQLETSSVGDGDAGLIRIDAPTIALDGAVLSSSSRSPADDAFLVEDAVVLFNDAFETMIAAESTTELVAELTPTFEAELGIDIEATEVDDFVDEVLQEADPETLNEFLAVLPFGLDELASVRVMPPPAGDVGAAGAILIAGDEVSLDASRLATITASTGDDAPSLIDVTAATRLVVRGSTLESDTRGTAPAGNILLTAPDLQLSGATLFAESFDGGTGNAGNIDLSGARIVIEDGTLLASRALTGAGDAGRALIDASETVEVRDSSIETSSVGTGRAGLVAIRAPSVQLTRSELSSSTQTGPLGPGAGEAGTIVVSADALAIEDSTLATVTAATVPGESATISLESTGTLTIVDSEVRADTSGPAPAGAVFVSGQSVAVTDSDLQALSLPSATGDAGIVSVDGLDVQLSGDSRIASRVLSDGGDAGGVRLAASSGVDIGDGVTVETSTIGRGDAGVIEVSAPDVRVGAATLASTSEVAAAAPRVGSAGAILVEGDTLVFEGSMLNTTTASTDPTSGSFIALTATTSLSLTNALLESDTVGNGTAGDVLLTGARIDLAGSNVFAESLDGATGDAGNILVTGDSVTIGAASVLASRALAGTGDAGTVTVEASDALTVTGAASIETSSIGDGDAGFIALSAPMLTVDDATLRSTSEAPFDAALQLDAAIDGVNAALGTDIREDTPEGFVAAITPLYESVLGIDIEATTPAAFVDEVFTEADFEALAAFQAQLPFELFEIAGLTTTPRAPGEVGDAGAILLAGAVIELRSADLSTTTSATRPGVPSDITITASERLTADDVVIEADTFGVSDAGSVTLSAPMVELGGTIASRAVGDALAPRGVFELGSALGVQAAGRNVGAFLADIVVALEATLGIDIEATTGTGIIDEVLDETAPPVLVDFLADLEAEGADLFVLDDLDGRGGGGAIGAAGEIRVAGTDIVLRGVDLTTTSESTVAGRPASIDVMSSGALLAENAVLTASTRAVAPAGDVSLRGATISLTDSRVNAESQETATGNAGNIVLSAETDVDVAGTEVASRSLSASGEAGSITLLAGGNAMLRASDGGVTTLTTSSTGAGRAGDILIDADTATLIEDTAILSESLGRSISGGVLLDLGTRLDMVDSTISTNSLRARGGDIVIITRGSEVFLTRSSLEASAGAEGSGGNILLDTDFLVLDDSAVLATAVAGNGGQIDIFSDAVVQDFFTTISADSETGNSGTVNISAPDNDMNAVVAAQDASPLVVPELVSDRCAPGAEAGSRLIVRPSTPVRSLPESPRSVVEVEERMKLSAVTVPCSAEGP